MYVKCMEMRMGFIRFLVLLLAIIALFSMSVLASGFEISGIGAKARGMSGAYRAIADDWSAAYYNPAGYAKIKDNQLGANSPFVHYRFSVTPDYRWGGVYESGIYNDQLDVNNHEILSNPSGGFLVRLPWFGEITTGLSVYQTFDQNLTWNLYDFPLAYNEYLKLPDDQYSTNLDVVAFQLTVAREYMDDKLALGIGFQLLRADLIYSNIYFRDNPYFDPVNPNPVAVRPWDKITQWNKNDGYGYGFGLNFGALYDVNENLKVGLNARVPFDITITGSSALEFYMPHITYIDSSAADDPSQPGTAGYLFVSGTKIVDSADYETKLQLPTSFGIGLAYQLNDKLLISLDAEYTLWSKFKGFDFTYTNHRGLTGAADTSIVANTFFTSNVSNPVDWENCGKVALGAVYDVSDYFTFIGGASDDQSPSRNNTLLTPQFMDTGDKLTFSGGMIWHYRQYDFGLVSSFTSYPDLSSPDLVDTNGDGLYDNFNGFYKGDSYETVFSFVYRF